MSRAAEIAAMGLATGLGAFAGAWLAGGRGAAGPPPPPPTIVVSPGADGAGLVVESSSDHDALGAYALDHPEDVDAWLALAASHASLGHMNQARAAWDRAKALDPSDPRFESPPEWAGVRMLSDEEREILANPTSDEAWGRHGAALVEAGRAAEAVPFLVEALRLDPADSEWPGLLAAAPPDPRIDQLLSDVPGITDDEAIGSRARLLSERGHEAEACRLYARALEIDPTDSEWGPAVQSCASQYPEIAQMLRGAAERSINELRQKVAENPGDDELHGDYGDALWAADRKGEACQAWRRAQQLDPADGEWPASLAQCQP